VNLGIIIPFGVFAFVVLIVALTTTVGVHDLETEIRYKMGRAELEHRRSMEELESELERVRHGAAR
jgi:hypothetical protein